MNDFKPVAPELRELAARWPVYTDSFELVQARMVEGRIERTRRQMACERCSLCHSVMVPPTDPQRVLRHLLAFHGYRMDGRQFDNANKEIGGASRTFVRDEWGLQDCPRCTDAVVDLGAHLLACAEVA